MKEIDWKKKDKQRAFQRVKATQKYLGDEKLANVILNI